jgi:enamine deaminase RidA (YjgF/YER057c/UK114 family)
MERRVIMWNELFNFGLAVEITRADRVLVCSGQISIEEGTTTILHPGDMSAQIRVAFENIKTVLGEAGYEMADIVRLNYYPTDVDAFMDSMDTVMHLVEEHNIRAAATTVGVTKLVFPDALIEIEAVAAR